MSALSGSGGTWHRRQATTILKDARKRYGTGWSLLSFEQRRNYCEARVLALLLTQEDRTDGERMFAIARGVCCALEDLNYRGDAS